MSGRTDTPATEAPVRDAYAIAGVDIDAGSEAVERILPHLARTARPEVVAMPGGFAGGFAIDPTRWRQPVLVSGADGVGTKLLVAAAAGRWDTIGIDAVAMCVNDIAVVGAEPLFFLDYLATGVVDPATVAAIVGGVAEGCARSGCTLLGGETAEMPGMYAPGHADVAGFAVGIVERDEVPEPASVRPGDVLVGIASSGLHSNGYSLVRSALLADDAGEGLAGDALQARLAQQPLGLDRPLVDELLEPTRIYSGLARDLVTCGDVRVLAHITGGGMYENVARVLPPGVDAIADSRAWEAPPIFELLREAGELDTHTMHRVFNMGIGLVAIVSRDRVEAVVAAAAATGVDGWPIGEIVAGTGTVRVLCGDGRELDERERGACA